MEALCVVISVHEIALSHRQNFCRFAGEKPAIGPHFISFRVNFHMRSGAIQHHGMLVDFASVRDGKKLFCQSKRLTLLQQGLADEYNRAFRQGAAERAEHWPIIFRLGSGNRSVRVSHDSSRDRPALERHVRLHAEKSWIPDADISELSDFDRADISRNALRYGRIDRVL